MNSMDENSKTEWRSQRSRPSRAIRGHDVASRRRRSRQGLLRAPRLAARHRFQAQPGIGPCSSRHRARRSIHRAGARPRCRSPCRACSGRRGHRGQAQGPDQPRRRGQRDLAHRAGQAAFPGSTRSAAPTSAGHRSIPTATRGCCRRSRSTSGRVEVRDSGQLAKLLLETAVRHGEFEDRPAA